MLLIAKVSAAGAAAGTSVTTGGAGSVVGASATVETVGVCASSALPAIAADASSTTATMLVPPIHFTVSLMAATMARNMVNGQPAERPVPPGDARRAIVNGLVPPLGVQVPRLVQCPPLRARSSSRRRRVLNRAPATPTPSRR